MEAPSSSLILSHKDSGKKSVRLSFNTNAATYGRRALPIIVLEGP
jgi:hypothetical protein